MRATDRWIAAGVVTVHAVVSLAHGWVHVAAPVDLTAAQWVFVILVITLAPLLALSLLWRRREEAGSALLAVSMAAAFAFGVYQHYLVPNPDNVASVVGPWSATFGWTAALVAVSELAGTAVGVWLWWRVRGTPREDASIST